MAQINLSIGQLGITNYLLVVVYYTDAPAAEVARQSIAPADLQASNQISFTGVLAKPAWVEVRESVDGTDLGTLITKYVHNVTDKTFVLEELFYTVGGLEEEDPAAGSTELTDEYFDGKTVASLFQQGFRPLKELKEGIALNGHEWQRVDNTLQLLNPETGLMDGPVFNAGETYVVTVSYLQDIIAGDSSAQPLSFVDITESITLTSTNRRKENVIEGLTTKITITLEPLATLVDGEYYDFVTNSGSQYQVVIQRSGSDVIRFNNSNKTRVVLGTSEYLRIAKKGTRFEVMRSHENLQKVGQKFTGMNSSYMNAMLYDATLRDGDEYPRIWDFIKSLPTGFAIVDSNIAAGSWTPAADKEACWYYYENGSKYFRTPNTQNLFSRPLKSFSSRNDDAARTYDNPGGTQSEEVGKHRHFTLVNAGEANGSFPFDRGSAPATTNSMKVWWNKSSGEGKESYYLDASTSEPTVSRTSEGTGTETRPRNYGEFEFVCI